MTSEPFHLSGKNGQAWLLPFVGFAAAAVSAFVYGWINVYSPIAGYVSILFVLLLALGSAMPVAFAGRWFRVRSIVQMRIAGAATGVATVWLAWACFAWVLLLKEQGEGPSLLHWARSPGDLFSFAQVLAESGWYSINGFEPKGAILWLLWAIEAVIVIGAGIKLAPSRIDDCGYCEDCDRWMEEQQPVRVPADKGAIGKAVREQGLDGIVEVDPPRAGAERWLQLRRQQCTGCDARVFRADDVKIVATDKGKKSVATPVLPWSWQREEEVGAFERIEGLLRAADEASWQSAASGNSRSTRRGTGSEGRGTGSS